MKAGWQVKKLGEVCEFQNGFAFKSNLFRETGLPIVRISNIQGDELVTDKLVYFDPADYKEDLLRYKVVQDDLLIAMSGGTTGKIGFNATNIVFYLNQRVGKFEPGKNLDKKFLYYFLSTKSEESLRISAGSAQPNLSTEQIKNFEIPIPPLAEQQRIVALLDEAFASIDAVKANAEQNLDNARELFDSYLAQVFSQHGEDWVEKRLGDIAEVQSGGTPLVANKDYWNSDIAWYSSGELNQIYTCASERTISIAGLNNSNAKLFPKGSLLIGMYDTAALKMSVLDRDATFNQAIAGVKPNEKVSMLFVLYAINAIKPQILSQRRGVRQKNLSLTKIKEIPIGLPNMTVQQAIVVKLDTLSAKTKKLEAIYRQKIAALDELKQSLLHQAFTGEL